MNKVGWEIKLASSDAASNNVGVTREEIEALIDERISETVNAAISTLKEKGLVTETREMFG